MKPIRYTQGMIDDYTSRGLWENKTMPYFWDQNARLYPDREALVDSGSRLTWAQAKDQTDKLALGLLALGLKRDDVILSQLPNCVEAILTRVACQKAGIISLAVPTDLPRQTLEYVIKLIGAVGIVIPHTLEGRNYFHLVQELCQNCPSLQYLLVIGADVPQGGISLLEMTRRPIKEGYPISYLRRTQFLGNEVTSLTLTTGSTGLPKCCEVAGNPSVLLGKDIAHRIGMTEKDTVACLVTALGVGLAAAYNAAPQVGAKVALLDRFDPEEALKLIEREKATIGVATPAQITLMARHPQFDRYDISSLRSFYWTGAPLPYHVAVEIENKTGWIMVGHYGTRDAGGLFMAKVDDPPEVRHLTVGQPDTGNEAKLVNEKGTEVPRGEIGEVLVRGAALCFPGYYRDLKMTLETYGEEGWFPTGDLGKFDEQKNLIIVGRKKDVILSAGKPIYPLEIENLLFTHPKVLNIVIVGLPDPGGGQKACACVTTKSGQEFTYTEMVSFLKEKGLDFSKIPQELELVERFPMLADGQKVDKRALSEAITQKRLGQAGGKTKTAG